MVNFTDNFSVKSCLPGIIFELQIAIEIPHIFVQTILYGAIVYSMMGFEWTASKFFWFIFFMYFTNLYFAY